MAETMDDCRVIDSSLSAAIEVTAATFSWDSVLVDSTPTGPRGKGGKLSKGPQKPTAGRGSEDSLKAQAAHASQNPFQLDEVNLTVPRGQLLAIVGAVGSGKSSLLQGLIGGKSRSSSFGRDH